MRDVIIIGAGGGGPVVAKELAERGLDVLVLEAGARHANPEQEWSYLENHMNSTLTGKFRVGPSDPTRPGWFRELTKPGSISQVAGVGGTTLHYYGNSPRAMPGVFAGYRGADRNLYDTRFRFPFTYDEMRPYYEWTEATLPVQTAAMGKKEKAFFDSAEAAGLSPLTGKDVTRAGFRPQENAILQPGGNAGKTRDSSQLRYPDATGCTFCGHCFQGCQIPKGAPRNLKARRSTDNSYIPMALTADLYKPGGKAVTLLSDAYVTRIISDRPRFSLGRVARGVEWRDTNTGETHSEEARVVIMAGGCIENPRLWHNSELPDFNGWVGRGLTDHALDWVVGQFPHDVGGTEGAASSSRADFPGYGSIENTANMPAIHANNLSDSNTGIRSLYDNGQANTGSWDGKSGRVYGTELKDMMSDVNRLMAVLILTDDDVEYQNRVDVSQAFTDEHGPVARVRMEKRNRSRRTVRNRNYLTNRAAEILRAGGASKIIRMDWNPVLLHMQSSMRMGDSARNSVLDENCEARAVEGLYIADHSALPNAIGGPNPTLTSQALATRTAEKIFQKHFGGDSWVSRESPVSSINDAVTRAVIQRGI
ncbi:GMC oxidoreductase [Marinobacter zhanjiangensis]|uniref:2-keto-gluconate dehydrogenase n=1 Tax=Marinobacter zhanjiangensis TaxID=578215 RepID=A0ABQ3B4S9_9GAMM|nr:GMC oxidoreductase [Marinobacter zhanjiangensis]GGY75195.1 2-keto-gluconate dehydrogenase [Marinobacter zhanjiangensis]